MIINYKKQLDKNNIIFLLFFLSILLNYIYIGSLYYVFYAITLILIIIDIFRIHNNTFSNVNYNKNLYFLLVIFITYSFGLSVLNYKTIGVINIFKLFNIFLVFFFCYL